MPGGLCCYCHVPRGITLRCGAADCCESFHFMCHWRNGGYCELRDAETVSAAVSAAETGHLVLSTLHSGGAASGADRIAGFFPPSAQPQILARLAQILTGVMSQRLARRAGGGRAAAAELLIATNAVRSCIREGKNAQLADIMRSGAQLGMTTLEQSLARLCREGAVDFDEALSLAPSPEELRTCLAAL